MLLSETPCYFDAHSSRTPALLGHSLSQSLKSCDFSRQMPVVLCIGSDRVTGDSLGPMVGSALQKRYQKSIPVFGTLEMPVHALNLEQVLFEIKEIWNGHPLIAVDASFGTKEHLGYITAGKGSLCPGAGVDKNLCAVGDFFVTGIVASFTPFSHLVLQATRLSAVIPLAAQITLGISHAIDALDNPLNL